MARWVIFPGLDVYVGQLHRKLALSLTSTTYPGFTLELHGTSQNGLVDYRPPLTSGVEPSVSRRIMLDGLNLDVLQLNGVLKLCSEGIEGARLLLSVRVLWSIAKARSGCPGAKRAAIHGTS